LHHAGLYVATTPLGLVAEQPDQVLIYNTPGRLASIHPARGEAIAAFIYRSPRIPDLDYRDSARHKQLVTDAFDGADWRVPELLDRVHDAEDLYFDAVSKVVLPTWTTGRIGLVGDAASCVSLLGDGSSLAIAGAHTLAAGLAEYGDHSEAMRAYEQKHRRLVEPKQRNIRVAAAMLVPKSRPALAARMLAAKFMR
jgi:2-polyprenyl-6-methoxyphenol hydroxylase-like FAD-dependent oxidoreductase